ncbi:24945_t:CDS:1, partial [Racocetra persica]
PDTSDSSVCLENIIDKSQIALKLIMKHVNIINVIEIWEVQHMSTTSTSLNYVVLLKDHSHI